jgi:hypothetical protein
MSVFTDDDLKRLNFTMGAHNWEMILTKDQWQALLARLEAEANAADLLELHYEAGVFDDLDEGDVALIVQALEAKRKAAGK